MIKLFAASFVVLATISAKQPCQECYIHARSDSFFSRGVVYVSEIKPYLERNCGDEHSARCPDRSVCVMTAVGPYRDTGLFDLEIGCVEGGLSNSCASRGNRGCVTATIHPRDVCYDFCSTTYMTVNGIRYTTEDTCNEESATKVRCAEGYACNVMKLSGKMEAGVVPGVEVELDSTVMSCGMTSFDFDVCETTGDYVKTAYPMMEVSCKIYDRDELNESL